MRFVLVCEKCSRFYGCTPKTFCNRCLKPPTVCPLILRGYHWIRDGICNDCLREVAKEQWGPL